MKLFKLILFSPLFFVSISSCKEDVKQPLFDRGIQLVSPSYLENLQMKTKPGDSIHLVCLLQGRGVIESIDLSLTSIAFETADPDILHHFESRYPYSKNALIKIDWKLPDSTEIPSDVLGVSVECMAKSKSSGTGRSSINIRLDRE